MILTSVWLWRIVQISPLEVMTREVGEPPRSVVGVSIVALSVVLGARSRSRSCLELCSNAKVSDMTPFAGCRRRKGLEFVAVPKGRGKEEGLIPLKASSGSIHRLGNGPCAMRGCPREASKRK